jgi:hypothetical protein
MLVSCLLVRLSPSSEETGCFSQEIIFGHVLASHGRRTESPHDSSTSNNRPQHLPSPLHWPPLPVARAMESPCGSCCKGPVEPTRPRTAPFAPLSAPAPSAVLDSAMAAKLHLPSAGRHSLYSPATQAPRQQWMLLRRTSRESSMTP